MKISFLVVSISAIGLVGCANNVWVHPSKNNAQFNQDKNDCMVQANNANPRQIVPQQPSPPPSYTTNCYAGTYSASCTTTPQVQPNYTATAQAIADGATNRARDNFFSSCMQSRGWTLQSAESVATNQAKNRDKLEQYKAAMSQITEEAKSLCTQPQFAPYYAKTSCSAVGMSLEQLSDNSRTTKKEKEALSKLDTALADIKNQRIDTYRKFMVPPALADEAISLQTRQYNSAQKLRLDLYNGKITWGQFNTERKRVAESGDAEFKAITKKYSGQ